MTLPATRISCILKQQAQTWQFKNVTPFLCIKLLSMAVTRSEAAAEGRRQAGAGVEATQGHGQPVPPGAAPCCQLQ